MADTTFRIVLPALKAVDLLDGTYAISCVVVANPGLTDTSFRKVLPALKAVNLGDGTYALSCSPP